MLLAEDLLLLLTDDESGKRQADTTRLDLALAGAVLLDLVELGRLDISGAGEEVKEGRLVVRNAAATDHPVLDLALERVAGRRPQKPAHILGHLTKGLRSSVYESLQSRGLVDRRRKQVLGIFPSDHWPAVHSAHEEKVRRALHDVLVVGRTPDQREVLLTSLLQSIDALPKVLGVSGTDKRLVRSRGKELAEGEPAGEAVGQAVMAARAAVIAAVSAAVAASSSGG